MWPFRNVAELSTTAEALFDHYSVEAGPSSDALLGPSLWSLQENGEERIDTPTQLKRYVTSFEVALSIEVLFGVIYTKEEVLSLMKELNTFMPPPLPYHHHSSEAASSPQQQQHRMELGPRLGKSDFVTSMCRLGRTLHMVLPPTAWEDELWNIIDRRGRGYVTSDDLKILHDDTTTAPTTVAFPQLVTNVEVLQASRTLSALDRGGDGRVAGSDLRFALHTLSSAVDDERRN